VSGLFKQLTTRLLEFFGIVLNGAQNPTNETICTHCGVPTNWWACFGQVSLIFTVQATDNKIHP